MKSLTHKQVSLCLGMIAAGLFLPGTVQAAYRGSSDAGMSRLDFIENQHRLERENRLSEAEQELISEVQEMQKHLRYSVRPDQPVPASFEGDELTYDQTTGEFTAVGKVHVVQMDGHSFDSPDSVRGNLQKQQVELPGKAHVIQITPGQSRVELDGYRAFYRYGAKTGSMESAKGKVDHQYVSGKRFEFYPDHIVIYDGTTTKCGAIRPDYHLSAERIEIYPNDKMILYKAKFWARGAVLFARDRYEKDLTKEEPLDQLPRIGYSKDAGVWLKQDLSQPVANRVWTHEHLYASTKHGGRSYGDLDWATKKAGTFALSYGYFEDSDENWVKRKPNLDWNYGHPIKGTPFSYGLSYRVGRWENQSNGIESTHTVYGFGISRAPIVFHRWYLTLSTGYSVTKESYDDSTVKGLTFDAALLKDFDQRWAAYAAYSYSKNNTRNSLFDFDLDDYSQKIQTGLSYRVTDRDRVAAALEWNAQDGELNDLDYYWFHDFHCTQLILRYRSKQDTWKVQWQFTPW